MAAVEPTGTRDRAAIEADEVAFFSHYYTEQAYNPLGWRLRLERELRSLLQAAGSNRLGRVLSIGCGAGEFELMLARVADSVMGLDLSPEAIEGARRDAARAGITNVQFECQSSADLATGETFDAVICLAFLHHVPEQHLAGFLQQVCTLVRPGGLFYSEDPNIRGVLRAIGRVALGKRYDAYHTPDERELDPVEVKRLLRAAGFAGVRLRYIDLTLIPATFMLARRPGWPLYAAQAVDWLWCHSPVAQWASGFAAFARRPL